VRKRIRSYTTSHGDVINRLTQFDSSSLKLPSLTTNRLTTRTLPNGVVSTYQYDGLDRLTRLTHAKTPNTLLDLQYQFNAVNNITQMIDGAGTHNYSYDTLDRLTTATHPNQTNESYTYDEVGNRMASHQGSSYSYQAFNRLVSANGTSFGYDANGNQIMKSDTNGSWSYSWDFENRLKQASLAGGVTVAYSYDALGRRVQLTSTVSGTEKFVYDGADVVRDLDATNATVAEYLNGPGIDNKLRQIAGGSASYFLPDHLGTTRSLADSTGTITSNLQYDSFGRPVSGSAPTRYTYTGREIDSDMDLTYYRARWYSSQQGRFLSEDPIGQIGGINLYSYVDNSSMNFTDPSGLERLQRYHMRITPPTDCGCNNTEILGHSAQFFAGFGDLISRGFADLAAELANHQSGANIVIPPGWSPTGYLRGMTPGGAVVDPSSNSYFAGQIAGVLWGMGMAVAGGRSSQNGPFIPEPWYAGRAANRAPTEYAPYGLFERFDAAGNLKQVTTYDAFGCRIRQFDLGPAARHGEGFHRFEYDALNPRQVPGGGRRGPQEPF
jgi:RHS repeat-associated protein